MQEALPQLETDQQTGSTRPLALGIAASVVLHAACTAVLLGLPQGPSSTQSVTYVDLGTTERQAPMTSPRQEPTPREVAQKPLPPSAPHTPVVPGTALAPETADATETPVAPPTGEHGQQAQEGVSPAATEATEEPSLTTLGIGLSKGYFKALGNGETLREDIKDYYLEMLQKINEKWWLDPKLDKRKYSVVIELTVARSGEIAASRILSGSGDRRYDNAVLAALTAANPLPPLPRSYHGAFFQAPVRLVPPLSLLAL